MAATKRLIIGAAADGCAGVQEDGGVAVGAYLFRFAALQKNIFRLSIGY